MAPFPSSPRPSRPARVLYCEHGPCALYLPYCGSPRRETCEVGTYAVVVAMLASVCVNMGTHAVRQPTQDPRTLQSVAVVLAQRAASVIVEVVVGGHSPMTVHAAHPW